MRSVFTRGYWFALILLVVLCLIYMDRRDLQGRYQRYIERSEEVNTLRGELEAAEQAEALLRERVEGLDSDTFELERTMRDMNWVREGERVYRVELPGDTELP